MGFAWTFWPGISQDWRGGRAVATEQPVTQIGDVIIRHDENKPAMWLVGRVRWEMDIAGSGEHTVTSRQEAIDVAGTLVSPERRIFIRIEDGDWHEVAAR
jgi:hypothetical protein